jgi:hypothetical protein
VLFLAWIGVKDAEEEARSLRVDRRVLLVKLAKKSLTRQGVFTIVSNWSRLFSSI